MVIRSINLETVCGITSVLPKNGKPEKAMEIISQGRNLASDSPLLLFLEG